MSNDQIVAVDFRDDMVYLRLADSRVIGNPLDWHLWLKQATSAQRAHVEMAELSAYWPDLDDGLDVEEMVKGMPPRARRSLSTTTTP